MKLLTKEIAETMPAIGATDEQWFDAEVKLKIFNSCGMQTWLLTEYDGSDLLFGWTLLNDFDSAELGYVSLSELQGVKNQLGLRLERDLYFKPKSLCDAIAELKKGFGLEMEM